VKPGVPIKIEDCPNYGLTFTRRTRKCKCLRCAICGNPKHTAIHGGIMGHENENVVWGHQYKPADET
jgi:hypothetical protein